MLPILNKKRTIISIGLSLVYAMLIIAMGSGALRYLIHMWNNPNYNYSYIIPLIILYFLWSERQKIESIKSSPSWSGLILLIISTILFWLGELGGEFTVIFLSWWMAAAGIVVLHFGWKKFRALGVVFILGLLMIPIPNFFAAHLTLKLRLLSSAIGTYLIRLVGMSAFREGNVIDLGFTALQVVDACSGLRYFFPILVLAVLIAHLNRLSFIKGVVLVLMAMPMVVLINAIRIAITAYLYPWFGKAVAEGFFHDFAGWFTFVLAILILAPFGRWLGREGIKKVSQRSDESRADIRELKQECHETRRQLVTTFIVLAFLGFNVGVSHAVNFRQRIQLRRPLSQFPLDIDGWKGRASSLSPGMIEELDLSDYILADYMDVAGHTINFYVAYYETQQKGESIHSPATCLTGSGWELRDSRSIVLDIEGFSKGFPVHRAIMVRPGARQLVYYWFYQRGRILTNAYQLKLYNFLDALTKRRTDGALIRLITPLGPDEPVENGDEVLISFMKLAIPLLDEYLPGEDLKPSE